MTTETPTVLREQDRHFLDAAGLSYTAVVDGGFVNLMIENFRTDPGLCPDRVELLVRLPFGFPDASPDMFWVIPVVTTTNGALIAGVDVVETWANRSWQRWSRHIAQQWRPGIDNLETYLAYIRRCLQQAGSN